MRLTPNSFLTIHLIECFYFFSPCCSPTGDHPTPRNNKGIFNIDGKEERNMPEEVVKLLFILGTSCADVTTRVQSSDPQLKFLIEIDIIFSDGLTIFFWF